MKEASLTAIAMCLVVCIISGIICFFPNNNRTLHEITGLDELQILYAKDVEQDEKVSHTRIKYFFNGLYKEYNGKLSGLGDFKTEFFDRDGKSVLVIHDCNKENIYEINGAYYKRLPSKENKKEK